MEDPEDVDFAKEVAQIMKKITMVCAGHDDACVCAALSGLIGAGAALGDEPDFEDLMRLVKETATASYENQRDIMRRGMN
jgi:hypothetical protein